LVSASTHITTFNCQATSYTLAFSSSPPTKADATACSQKSTTSIAAATKKGPAANKKSPATTKKGPATTKKGPAVA
jgi:hypothetical protein